MENYEGIAMLYTRATRSNEVNAYSIVGSVGLSIHTLQVIAIRIAIAVL